jgi:hypothetical protein
MKALPDYRTDGPVKTYLMDGLHFRRSIQNVRVRDIEVEMPVRFILLPSPVAPLTSLLNPPAAPTFQNKPKESRLHQRPKSLVGRHRPCLRQQQNRSYAYATRNENYGR